MSTQVPFTGAEKESLHASLNRHRAVVRWKVAGLTDEQARRPMTGTGLSLGGVVKHLASVEYGWFCGTFGRPSDELDYDENDPDRDLRVEPDETLADVVAYYDRACAAADAAIDELDLMTVGTSWHGDELTMRWVLIHMVEETARHCGHLDVMREQLDGAVGDHQD